MAKGVVAYPVTPASIDLNTQLVLNYGVQSVNPDFYCLGRSSEYNNNVPRIYCGRYPNGNVCIISTGLYSAGTYIAAAASTSTKPETINMSRAAETQGMSYYYFVNSYSPYIRFCPKELTSYDEFTDVNEMAAYIANLENISIRYISGAISVAGPKIVAEGSTVNVYLSIPSGVAVTDSDIVITKQGVTVPFTYSNGVLTFSV